jgi:hypothetical protein
VRGSRPVRVGGESGAMPLSPRNERFIVNEGSLVVLGLGGWVELCEAKRNHLCRDDWAMGYKPRNCRYEKNIEKNSMRLNINRD